MTTQRGFGVAATVAPHLVRRLAPAAEDAGYTTFWTNDGPDGDGLALLRIAAEQTTAIRLGVGLLPLDRWTPEQIVERTTELDLPPQRLILGVGSGAASGALGRVSAGVAALRGASRATIVVGALGPRMRRLAAERADGVMLDWVTPAYAQHSTADVEAAARRAERPRPCVVAYVFTALGSEGSRQLRAEAAHYGAVPAYASHFQRMEAAPLDAAVAADTPDGLRRALADFDGALDEAVVRAVPGTSDPDAYVRLLQAASPHR